MVGNDGDESDENDGDDEVYHNWLCFRIGAKVVKTD